jgi:hypothetical protein
MHGRIYAAVQWPQHMTTARYPMTSSLLRLVRVAGVMAIVSGAYLFPAAAWSAGTIDEGIAAYTAGDYKNGTS